MIDINKLREAIQTFGSQAINEDDLNELINRLEVAEKNLRCCQAERAGLVDDMTLLRDHNTALRAMVEAMERQEPSHWGCTVLQSDGRWKEEVSREAPPEGYFSIRDIFPLYAIPGVKGE